MMIVGVDVGGTFTDLILADTQSGQRHVHKTASTPADPANAVMTGLIELCAMAGIERSTIDHLLHGTTVATNAILEHKGAVTGMITNAGYRDILHIGRHQRPQNYSIQQEIPWQDRPLIKRRHRLTVPERRIPPKGEVLVELDEEAVRAAALELKAAEVEAIAIGFLFSYLDPASEERAAAIVREVYPQAYVTTSASVAPQFREFERFTTAAMNAFIGPKVRTYVSALENRLASEGFSTDLHIMGSNGGVATAAMVADKPVMTLLSGPAAGIMGGAWAGRLSATDHVITFDVGGTSADIGIVTAGRMIEATARDTSIAGFPLLTPILDIHTIGAGGGSIAYQDTTGAFRVGPESAGARPGPAAYGHGGNRPTVTDAHVVLGRLDPDNFLGGGMSLDVDASTRVIGALAVEVGLTPEATAQGILTIINANMANAISSRTVQKGIDPRDYALVAMGGAGPLHGVDVAAELGIPTVIVPPHPGITSAVGLLTTDLKYDAVKTCFQRQSEIDTDRLASDFDTMLADLTAQLEADGVAPKDRHFTRSADIRYVGQGYELRVSLPPDGPDEAAIQAMIQAFHRQHAADYGHAFEDSPIDMVNIRLTATGTMPKLPKADLTNSARSGKPLKTATCQFMTNGELKPTQTPFYRRDDLPIGLTMTGPAIILQLDTTTVIPPGANFIAEAAGNLVIRLEGTQS